MNYFDQIDYISNSDLGALKELMRLQEEKDLSKVYNFGSLLDAIATEDHKVDHEQRALIQDTKTIFFQEEEFDKAKAMHEAGLEDAALRIFIETAKTQHEVYRKKFEIQYQGTTLHIPTRCKLDFLREDILTGADLKSTVCKTFREWRQAIEFFDYDRQGSWYMDHKGLDRFMIIGISKHKDKLTRRHKVFKFVINRGDEMYEQGKRKYSYLAFYYYHLIYNLNIQNALT